MIFFRGPRINVHKRSSLILSSKFSIGKSYLPSFGRSTTFWVFLFAWVVIPPSHMNRLLREGGYVLYPRRFHVKAASSHGQNVKELFLSLRLTFEYLRFPSFAFHYARSRKHQPETSLRRGPLRYPCQSSTPSAIRSVTGGLWLHIKPE